MNLMEFQSCPPDIVLLMVVTMLLLMMSGMMSASEVAYFSLLPSDLRNIRQRGSLASEGVMKLLKNSDSLLATILVVNNLVNIWSSTTGQEAQKRRLTLCLEDKIIRNA